MMVRVRVSASVRVRVRVRVWVRVRVSVRVRVKLQHLNYRNDAKMPFLAYFSPNFWPFFSPTFNI